MQVFYRIWKNYALAHVNSCYSLHLIDSLDELQKLAKDAFGVAAQTIIEQFIYAKMPPHLMKSINQAYLENGTY